MIQPIVMFKEQFLLYDVYTMSEQNLALLVLDQTY